MTSNWLGLHSIASGAKLWPGQGLRGAPDVRSGSGRKHSTAAGEVKALLSS